MRIFISLNRGDQNFWPYELDDTRELAYDAGNTNAQYS